MIKPFTFFYDSINRNAIVVKPQKPFFDWINFIYPESPVYEKEEANIYRSRLAKKENIQDFSGMVFV